jgi:hypothetical protein
MGLETLEGLDDPANLRFGVALLEEAELVCSDDGDQIEADAGRGDVVARVRCNASVDPPRSST